MSIGEIYYLIYYVVITFMTLAVWSNYQTYSKQRVFAKVGVHDGGLALLLLALIITIGLRPPDRLFTDMSNYIQYMNKHDGEAFFFNWLAQNKIYDNYMLLLCSMRLPPTFLFFTTAIVYFGCIGVALKKIFPKDAMLAVLVYLAAFSTLSYGTNGIKSGAAASVFLLAIAYRKNLLCFVVFSVVSYGIHHSMFFVIAGTICVNLYKNSKTYFAFWVLAIVCALLHVTFFQELFASASDDKGASYLSITEGTDYFRTSSFRIDFVAYSALPIYIGYKMIYKYKVFDENYRWLLNLYIVLNAIWILCMYAEFTNRIAYLSWFIYPIVTIYPYLKSDVHPQQYKKLGSVVFIQLGFSLFMHFVYYQFIKVV